MLSECVSMLVEEFNSSSPVVVLSVKTALFVSVELKIPSVENGAVTTCIQITYVWLKRLILNRIQFRQKSQKNTF